MAKNTFTIQKISCGHCVNAIKTELGEIKGVLMVAGDPETKKIEVEWETPASLGRIRDRLKEINYPAD